MNVQTDLVDSLEQTFTHAQSVIANVREGQYEDETPCSEWKVRDLLGHLIGVVAGIGAAAGGRSSPPPSGFELGPDPAAQFREAAAASLSAWRAPGVLERVIDGPAGPMPGTVLASINVLDTATHTWDLATATGQPAELPEAVAAAAVEASRMIVTPETRPGRFGPELDAPAGASTTQRLVAFLGRPAAPGA
jgi:uncharacterized protein (TIGR03086 family)